MDIRILECLQGAAQASGTAVVLDVFRATSNIVTMLWHGAGAVIPVMTVEEARRLKEEHPGWILAGEHEGLPPEGFDLGNSPYLAQSVDFNGRTVILTTSAGSKGLVEASRHADEVLVGCFLNAESIAACLREKQPQTVSLIALGVKGEIPSPEDTLCAEYIRGLLLGSASDPESLFKRIGDHPEGKKFLDPKKPNYIPEDFHACLRSGVYDLIPQMLDGRVTVQNRGIIK